MPKRHICEIVLLHFGGTLDIVDFGRESIMVKSTNPKTRRILMITLIILGVTPIVTILYLTYQMRTALSEADQALQENGKLYNRLKASMGTKPEIPAHKLGDRIELGNQAITVYGFEPYSEPGMKRHYGVSKGVAMDILVENTGTDSFKLNPLFFTVQ